MPRLPKEEHEHRLELYEEGLNDREIGERIGIGGSGVCEWRRKNNLSSNPNSRIPKTELKYRYKLYKQGLLDREIGKKVGRAQNTICQWRIGNNLPSNYKIRMTKNNGHRLELHKQGLHDYQIGKMVNLTISGVDSWRKRNNLSVNPVDTSIQLDFTPSWELGYLIGIIVGDGGLNRQSMYRVKVLSPRKDYIDLIENILNISFPQLSTNRYSYNSSTILPNGKPYNARYYAVSVGSKNLYNFLKRYKKEDYIWLTPDDQPEIVKYGFIGGIIDAEGCISPWGVGIASKPKQNLLRLKELLADLGFIYGKTSIIKANNNCYTLNIYGTRNHKLLLEKAKLPYKREKLERVVERRINGRYNTVEEYWTAMELRNKMGWGKIKIGKTLNISIPTVSRWIYMDGRPQSLMLAEKYGTPEVVEIDRQKYLSKVELPI